MKREQKTAVVEEIASRLGEAEAIFAIDYRGISVPQAAELRSRLAEAEALFSVVKNRLAKRAAEQAGTEGLDDLLVGPTALTLIKGDPVTAAKALSTFSREHQVLSYKGGIMDGAPLDADGFNAIARLPALDVLHGQLVGVTASPLTGLARGLGSMVSGLAVALGQIQEQGLVEGEAPEQQEEQEQEPAPPQAETPAVEEEPVQDEPGEHEAETPAEEEPAGEEPREASAETDETEQVENDPALPGDAAGEATGSDDSEE
jgi:large subunit ribosomal protein L10